MTKTRGATAAERVLDVGCGRCLQLRVVYDVDSRAESFTISEGWHEGGRDYGRSIGPIRGTVLPELIEVLQELSER